MQDTLDGIGNPGDPKNAVDMHAELVAANKGTEAVEMAAARLLCGKKPFTAIVRIPKHPIITALPPHKISNV
jgi:hypothetical protein